MPVLSGERWASTGAITTISWSFATANYPSLQQKYSGYKDFDTSINATYRATIEAAFGAWEAVANIDFVQVADSATVNIRVGNLAIDGRASPGGSSVLGTTQKWFIGTLYSAAEIYFDVDAYDQTNLYETAVHEVGHALGLDHSPIVSAVMYYLTNAQNMSGTLTVDDIQGITAIYGGRAAIVDDYAATSSTTGLVAVGGSIKGTLETIGDTDWFKVTLTAGHTYRLDLEGAATTLSALPDPLLVLHNSTGAIVTSIDDGGVDTNSSGTFVATVGGTYFLEASSYSDASSKIGGYKLSVTDITPSGGAAVVAAAGLNILRQNNSATVVDLSAKVTAGTMSSSQAIGEIIKAADATTTVATLAYQFFTGKIPSQAGYDFLIATNGPNTQNLNSAYYAKFDTVNRYINFAMNLGKYGEAKDSFAADYGALTLFEATRKAYATIFGGAPNDAKVTQLLDGGRVSFLSAFSGDGAQGIGTKAAMVGFLLAAAATEDVGMYARSSNAFLADLADGATFGINLVGVYGKAEYSYAG